MTDFTDLSETIYYQELTWQELDLAAEADALILIPVGSTEDHGHHLPVDVDQRIPEAICERTASHREDTLVFPTISQGYLPHGMDMPGSITLQWDTFVNQLFEVGISLAHHGFEKLVFLNGHGSNHHLVEQATRQVVVQRPDIQAAMLSWWEIEEFRAVARERCDAGVQGSGHGGEMETSMYLHLYPDRVQMEKARRDLSFPKSKHFNNVNMFGADIDDPTTAVTLREWRSMFSETGVRGDPRPATAAKGAAFLEAAAEGLDSILTDFANYPVRPIDDKHTRDVPDADYDPFRPR